MRYPYHQSPSLFRMPVTVTAGRGTRVLLRSECREPEEWEGVLQGLFVGSILERAICLISIVSLPVGNKTVKMSRSAFCYQLLFGTLVIVLASALNAETLKDLNIFNEANETTTLSEEITTLNFNTDEYTDRYDVLDTTENDQNGDESNLNISTNKNNDNENLFLNEDNSKNQRQNDSSISPEGNEVENSVTLTQLGNANSNIDFNKKDDTKSVQNNMKESSVSGVNFRSRIHELTKMFGFENENVPPEYITILEKMKPEERLASTLAFKKRYIEAHFDPVTYFNKTGPPLETETSENYGISIVLSSDIMTLTSVVETMDDSLCKNQSLRLLRGLLTGKLWAQKSK